MGLEARDKKFLLDGKEIMLFSGAMHYFRVVPEYWRDRMLRMKACGLNCLETYVPWNLHEEVKGEFNFEGILNVRKFIQLAHELGLYVLFRPGPYICSEWDFGGLPSWLLSDKKMKVRSSYQPYLDAVDKFFAKLLPIVTDLQCSKGGPIIAVQIENEYGSYGNDLVYKNFLRDNMKKYGICEMFFTSDNGTGIGKGEVPGELATANFQELEHGYMMYEYMKNVKQPDMPLMVMEFWTGWFDHWNEEHHYWPVKEFEKVLTWILEQNSSVNFYMIHGGTNFGFMAGANEGLGATNEEKVEPYHADVTSYDYDSPISENGDLTEKWIIIKRLLKEKFPQFVNKDIPEPPTDIKAKSYGKIDITKCLSFEDLLTGVEAIKSKNVLCMEELPINNGGGQGYGYVLYRTTVGAGAKLKLCGEVKDRAIIYVNGEQKEIVDWTKNNHEIQLGLTGTDNLLDILVENLGRVNYADYESDIMDNQRKGLVNDVLLDGKKIAGWDIYPLEFKTPFVQSSESRCGGGKGVSGKPSLCSATLKIDEQPCDTYLNMKKWGKGIVFINGFNIGRYWEVGPQGTLYCPGPLLKKGTNTITVFEMEHVSPSIEFSDTPDHGPPVVHTTVIPDVELPTK